MCMKVIREYVKNHVRSQRGQGIVEYALILAFMVAVAVAIQTGGLSDAITGLFGGVTQQVQDATPNGGGNTSGGNTGGNN